MKITPEKSLEIVHELMWKLRVGDKDLVSIIDTIQFSQDISPILNDILFDIKGSFNRIQTLKSDREQLQNDIAELSLRLKEQR